MKLEVFGIWDEKAKAYLPPFFMFNKAVAVRSFTSAVQKPGSEIQAHPEDYTLFRLAEFDDSTGMFLQDAPEMLVNGVQVRER